MHRELESLSNVQGIEYIVKLDYIGDLLRKYSLIYPDGKPNPLTKGVFQLRDIGEVRGTGFVNITLINAESKEVKQYQVSGNGLPEVILNRLLALIHDIDQAGS